MNLIVQSTLSQYQNRGEVKERILIFIYNEIYNQTVFYINNGISPISYTFLDQNYGNSFREVLKELDLSATLKGLVLLDINFGTFVGEMRLAYLRNSNNFETKESINNIILEKIRFFLTNRFEVIWELEIEDNIINKFRYLNLFFSEPYKRTQLQSNSIYMSVLNNFYFDFNLKSEIYLKFESLYQFHFLG